MPCYKSFVHVGLAVPLFGDDFALSADFDLWEPLLSITFYSGMLRWVDCMK